MKIREATQQDIPEIVKVLKASLGETDLPLSENIWNFKHTNNPFGKSLVLVATENKQIIGVRAFMRWQWQLGEQVFPSFRAVDTATHPHHQGKGVFKKLTLKAVELAKEEGVNFIFNTPNDQSRPGYLKMGWKAAGKIKVALMPSFFSFWKFNREVPQYNISKNVPNEQNEILCGNWNKHLLSDSILFTPKSTKFLKWRYEENPLQKYEVILETGYYLAVYVKQRKKLKELRIAECIFTHKSAAKSLRKDIKVLALKYGVQVISFSPQVLDIGTLTIKGNYGPILTVLDFNMIPQGEANFLNIENWSYSLGDLELF